MCFSWFASSHSTKVLVWTSCFQVDFSIFILFLKTEKRKLLENVFSFGEYKFKYKHFDAARDVNLETDI